MYPKNRWTWWNIQLLNNGSHHSSGDSMVHLLPITFFCGCNGIQERIHSLSCNSLQLSYWRRPQQGMRHKIARPKKSSASTQYLKGPTFHGSNVAFPLAKGLFNLLYALGLHVWYICIYLPRFDWLSWWILGKYASFDGFYWDWGNFWAIFCKHLRTKTDDRWNW